MSAAKSDLIVVGRIGSPYGVRGWMRITSYTDPPENLGRYQPWELPAGSFNSVRLKPHQQGFVGQLPGIDDRDAAAQLAGQEIKISASLLPTPADGEYYWRDLVGLQVLDCAGHCQGSVLELLATGVHDVLVIAAQDGQEILVPFVSKFVQQVDMTAKTITVDWPEFDPGCG